jgi:hypothetical protein
MLKCKFFSLYWAKYIINQYLVMSPLAAITISSLLGLKSLKVLNYTGLSSSVHSCLIAAVSLGTKETFFSSGGFSYDSNSSGPSRWYAGWFTLK